MHVYNPIIFPCKYVKLLTNPKKYFLNFRLYNLEENNLFNHWYTVITTSKVSEFSVLSLNCYILNPKLIIACSSTFLCTSKRSVSANWWRLFHFKLLLSVNEPLLLIYRNFLSHRSVQVGNWKLIHQTAIKGSCGSLSKFNDNHINQSKRKYLVLQNRKESLTTRKGKGLNSNTAKYLLALIHLGRRTSSEVREDRRHVSNQVHLPLWWQPAFKMFIIYA